MQVEVKSKGLERCYHESFYHRRRRESGMAGMEDNPKCCVAPLNHNGAIFRSGDR